VRYRSTKAMLKYGKEGHQWSKLYQMQIIWSFKMSMISSRRRMEFI